MAQLAASIVSHDEEFKRQVARLLRACGVPVGILEERRPGSEVAGAGPDLVVVDSAFGGKSPRVFPIPLYDPITYDSGKRNGRTADLVTANWIGFFLESTAGNGIWGRIIPIAGIRDNTAGPAPMGLNPKAIRLVQ